MAIFDVIQPQELILQCLTENNLDSLNSAILEHLDARAFRISPK